MFLVTILAVSLLHSNISYALYPCLVLCYSSLYLPFIIYLDHNNCNEVLKSERLKGERLKGKLIDNNIADC